MYHGLFPDLGSTFPIRARRYTRKVSVSLNKCSHGTAFKTEALYIWGVRHKGERQGGPDLVLHIVYAGHAEVQNLYVKSEED